MARSGRAGIVAAVIAACSLPSAALAELELTPVPVVPVTAVDAQPAVQLDLPGIAAPVAPPPAGGRPAERAPETQAPSAAAAPQAAPEPAEEEPDEAPDDAPVRRQRQEAWAVHCFQGDEEVLTVAPLYRVLEVRNGMQDWYYETETGVRFAGRVGTNVNCYYEPLDAGAARVASVAPGFAATPQDSALADGAVDVLGRPAAEEPEDTTPPPRPAWTEPDAAPRPPSGSQPPAMSDGPWVQLAALPSAGCARAEWRRLGRNFGGALAHYQPMIVRLHQAGQTSLYGLRVYPPDRVAAVELCTLLEAGGQACRLPRGDAAMVALAEVAPVLGGVSLPAPAIPTAVGFEARLATTAPPGLSAPAPREVAPAPEAVLVADAAPLPAPAPEPVAILEAPPVPELALAPVAAPAPAIAPASGAVSVAGGMPAPELALSLAAVPPAPGPAEGGIVADPAGEVPPVADPSPAILPGLQPEAGTAPDQPELQFVAVMAPLGRPAAAVGAADHPALVLDRELFEPVDLIATRMHVAPGGLVAPGPPAILQLAVYERQSDAVRAWQILSAAHPSLLGGHRPVIDRAERASGVPWYRIRLMLPSRATAEAACRQLRDAGDDCWVVE